MKDLTFHLITSISISCCAFFSVTYLQAKNPATTYNKPLLIISIPKAGTHLLQRCIELLTGYQRSDPENKRLSFDFTYYPKLENFEKLVLDAPKNTYRMLHLRHTPAYERYFQEQNVKVIYIFRDPRAVLVSRINYMRDGKCPEFRYKRWPISLLLFSFIGQVNQEFIGIRSWDFKRRVKNHRALCNIAHLYQEFDGWRNSPWALTTSFEKLVGPRGGGTLCDQLNEITKIAHYLEIAITPEETLAIADKLFGGTATFLHGQIANWEEHFTQEHRKMFKIVAPTLLQTLGYEKDNTW